MKNILILCLICFALCDETGPAYNYKHPNSDYNCESASNSEPNGVSDCADSLLWSKHNSRYYDRCCFLRYQFKGVMNSTCVSLTEEQYLDISETIRRIEDGDPLIIDRATAGSKVYQLDCKSNYLKALTIASILLSLIF